MTEKVGFWMYGIIENKGTLQWDCLGIHGTSPVTTVVGGEFAAVVSEEPMKKYPLVRDYLIAHQHVNETIMKVQKVLPVKFCTMADHPDRIIEEVLIPKREEFRENLSRIENKEEYGLRVRWKDLDQIFREIGEQDEKLREKKEKISRLSEEKRRYELIDIGHLVQEAVSNRNKEMARKIMQVLSPLASETKENNVLGDAMILNAAFLVSREKQTVFDQEVNTLDEQHGARLQLKYVGPIPPFNFIEIVIRWKEEAAPLTRPSAGAQDALSLKERGMKGTKNVSTG